MNQSETNNIELRNENEEIAFYNNSHKLGSVKIGWDYVATRFVKSQIPSEAEVEYAINYIEDELMKDMKLVNTQYLNLVTSQKDFVELLGQKGNTVEYSTDEIEKEFTKYALLSMGRSPVVDGISLNNKRYILLLVIREILHHLKFRSIKILG